LELYKTLVGIVRHREQEAQNAVRLAVAQAGKRVNALAPINKLTEDALISVFSHLENIHLINVSAVCTYWRRVAISASSLWTHLYLYGCSGFRKRASLLLSRSRSAPLDIQLRMIGDLEPLEDEFDDDHDTRMDEAEVAAEMHIQDLRWLLKPDLFLRLRSLDVLFAHTCGCEEILSLPSSPMLERLTLSWEDSPLPLVLFLPTTSRPYPKLTHVRLQNVENFLGTLKAFTNVSDLTLGLLYNDMEINISMITTACPQLKALRFIDIYGAQSYHYGMLGSTQNQRPPLLNFLAFQGPSAQAVVECLCQCIRIGITSTIPSLAISGSWTKAELGTGMCIFDDIKPRAEVIRRAGHLYSRVTQAARDTCRVQVVVNDGAGMARSLIGQNIAPGVLPSFAGKFTRMTLSVEAITAPAFPTVLPNLTALRIHIINGVLPSKAHHKVSVAALRELEVYSGISARHSEPVKVDLEKLNALLALLFAKVVFPLDRIALYGLECTDTAKSTRKVMARMAQTFQHRLRVE